MFSTQRYESQLLGHSVKMFFLLKSFIHLKVLIIKIDAKSRINLNINVINYFVT